MSTVLTDIFYSSATQKYGHISDAKGLLQQHWALGTAEGDLLKASLSEARLDGSRASQCLDKKERQKHTHFTRISL